MRFSKPKSLNLKLLSLIGLPVCIVALVVVIFVGKDTKAPQNNASLKTVKEQARASDAPPKTEEATITPTDTATSQPAKVTSTAPATTLAPTEVKNPYQEGFDYWYVFNRRTAVGKPVGTTWVNPQHWLYYAKQDGYTVDMNPEKWAISVRGMTSGNVLAFVESVNDDGSLTMSAMNYTSGWNRTDTFQVGQAELSAWIFIH